MDLLGKQGEEALENVEKVSGNIQKLESHLNAVDSALQDFMDNSQALMAEEVAFDKSEVQALGRVEGKSDRGDRDLETEIDVMRREIMQMKKVQKQNKQKIDAILDSELLEIIGKVRQLINQTNKRFYDLRDALQAVEQRVNKVENDFILEVNSREFDFERKVDRTQFENREKEVRNELKKLRTSINALADEVDGKDKISVN